MSNTWITPLLAAALVIVALTSASSYDPFKYTDCHPKICWRSNYSNPYELKWVTSLVIEARSNTTDQFESSQMVSVDVGNTSSYLSQALKTFDETDTYFHVNSGLWISQFPLLGNGMLHSISLNISHGGVVQVYSMSLYKNCNRLNMFWRCLDNSSWLLENDWGDDITMALDELEFLSAGLLEDTFYVVNSVDVQLSNAGDQEKTIDLLVQKGHFIGFESVNATLICNDFNPMNTIVYSRHETPIWSSLAPFFALNFEYKAYQPYELKFNNLIIPSTDFESLDVSFHTTLNATDGTVSIERLLPGYFSSYLMTFEIPNWDVLYNGHDPVSFNLLAIINGHLIGLPNTSMSLNKIINMPPPAKIHLSNSVIRYPKRKLKASLRGENGRENRFMSTVKRYRWKLSVLPSNTTIKSSSKKKFQFSDFVMPGNYRLSLEFDTKDNVAFKLFTDIEYVSDAFTFIRCLRNCDPSFTTGHVKLQLSVDVALLLKLNYEIVSAKWSVAEKDTKKLITGNVTPFNDLVEISIDTSVLTKLNYVVDLVIVTFDRNNTIHDDYHFKMSYPQYKLECSIFPAVGISLDTAHNISCTLFINNIACSLCVSSKNALCDLCDLSYTYYFKFCLDHVECKIQLPLIMGNKSQPMAMGILLPVGNEQENFDLTTIVCMYDEKGKVEYAHELVAVLSKPNPSLTIDGVLNDALLALDSSTNVERFHTVQKVGIALSHGEVSEILQNQVIEILKKVEQQNDDVSLMMFSILYPFSQMKVNDDITKDLSSITNQTYQSIQTVQEEVTMSASNAVLSIMWSVVESNVEISNVQMDVPELNLYFHTESPDEAYYNKWVAFDVEEEFQSNKDSIRSSDICSTLHALQDYVAQHLKKGAALGEISSLNLANVEYYLGRLTAAMLISGNQLVGKSFVKVPSPRFNDISFADTISISFVKFNINPCILTANSDRVKSAVIGMNITDFSGKKVVIHLDKPLEVLVPLNGQKSLQEFLYKPEYDWLYLQLDIYAKPHSVLFLQILSTRATTLLIKYGSLPKILDHDLKFELPNLTADKRKEDRLNELGFTPLQDPSLKTIRVPLKSNGTYFIGARVGGNKVRRFWLLPYMTSCLKWTGDGWSISSENVGILSNSTSTHCKFHELSLYAADLSYPNLTVYTQPIPKKKLVSRALDSLKIWIPLIVIYGYLLSTVTYVLRLQDRDLRSTNLLYLLSSNETKHTYKIEVRTGLRPKAGTTSQVYLELQGSKASRKVKVKQNSGELFETNQTSTFLFYSDVNIGRIDRIYVWIDYTGSHPDWFLESVKITDSEDHVYLFLYNNWIGYDIERYTCCIFRYIPSEVSLLKRIMTCLVECIVNYHSAVSNLLKGTRIFPPRTFLTSLFVSRCLTLLCLVVLNFENSIHDNISSSGLWKLVFLLLTTYPVFFLMEKWQEYLYKNERHNFLVAKKLNRHVSETSGVSTLDLDKYFWVTSSEKSKKPGGRKTSSASSSHDEMDEYFKLTAKGNLIEFAGKHNCEDPGYEFSDEEMLHADENEVVGGRSVKVDDYFKFFWDEDTSIHSSAHASSMNFEKPVKTSVAPSRVTFKFSSRALRKFLVIFTYISIVTTTCFYLFYTYSSKSIHLDTCLIHFLVVITLLLFVEQPLICGVITLIYSNRLWYGAPYRDTHCDTILNADETDRSVTKHPEIKSWRHTIIKRRKMNSVITKLFSYIAFIIIVVVLSKQDRQTNCYYLNTSVRKTFATPAFDAIETKADFWKWIQNEYSSTLSSDDFFEGTRAKVPKERYLKDGSSIIISISRLKQVRIKRTWCSTNEEGLCDEVYSPSLLEKKNFNPGWKEYTPAKADAWFSIIRYKSYWKYHDGIDGVEIRGNAGIYPAGGYKVPLANSPLNAKKQLKMLELDGYR